MHDLRSETFSIIVAFIKLSSSLVTRSRVTSQYCHDNAGMKLNISKRGQCPVMVKSLFSSKKDYFFPVNTYVFTIVEKVWQNRALHIRPASAKFHPTSANQNIFSAFLFSSPVSLAINDYHQCVNMKPVQNPSLLFQKVLQSPPAEIEQSSPARPLLPFSATPLCHLQSLSPSLVLSKW